MCFLQAVPEAAAPLERVAEDTRPVNSLSYLPMSKLTKERWSEADTDKFYYALQTVGCDFTMIAKFFDGRTRKQVRPTPCWRAFSATTAGCGLHMRLPRLHWPHTQAGPGCRALLSGCYDFERRCFFLAWASCL